MAQGRSAKEGFWSRVSGSRLKLAGGITLILSFASQSLLLDYYNGKSASIRTAMLERAVIDKGAQLSELLYLTFPNDVDSALGGVRVQKIREAAQKRAFSSIMTLVSNDSISRLQAARLSNALLEQATGVHDYRSYADFLREINASDAVFATAWQPQLDRIESARGAWRATYFLLYIIGTGLVLVGEFKESRAKRGMAPGSRSNSPNDRRT